MFEEREGEKSVVRGRLEEAGDVLELDHDGGFGAAAAELGAALERSVSLRE
jgi:hypothetical protein